MANINLVTGGEVERPEPGIFSGGTIIIFTILILVMAAYGGVYFYGRTLDQEIASTQSQYKEAYEKLLQGKGKDIVDFQYRLDEAKESFEKSKNIRTSLQAIEASMIPGSYLDSYSFDDVTGLTSIEGVADNYNILARQVLSFKKQPEFSSVAAGETSFDTEKNKVQYKMELMLKN
jgi:hypothetical protein